MSLGESIAPLIGRMMLAWFFLSEAYIRATNWDATISLLAASDVPAPPVLHFIALMIMVMGSLSLILGIHARLGALGLFGFIAVSNALMHDYWNIEDVIARQADFDIFIRNLAIGGGLLVLTGAGPGKFAVENVKRSSGDRQP